MRITTGAFAACTVGSTCNGNGVCGTVLVCDDHREWTTDTCDPARGCVYTNRSGACTPDANQCTDDACAAGRRGCVSTPAYGAASGPRPASVGDHSAAWARPDNASIVSTAYSNVGCRMRRLSRPLATR